MEGGIDDQHISDFDSTNNVWNMQVASNGVSGVVASDGFRRVIVCAPCNRYVR